MEARAGRFKHILNVEDMRREACRRLPRAIFDFIDGAAEDEVSRRRNRMQFEDWGFVQRVLNDVSRVDMSLELFGRRYAAPFGIGPTGLAGLAWPRAEILLAKEAVGAGIPLCLSTVSSVRLEEVADAAGPGAWFQLYIFRNRDLSRSLLARAKTAGFEVLVLTVDCATGGNRERDPRNDFMLPLKLTRRNVLDTLRHPGWLMRLAKSGAPRPENMVEAATGAGASAQGLVAFMNSQLDPSVTWTDVAEFTALWKGPVIIKGLLSVHDVLRAADIGASGVILSNHGGRQLDGAVSPLTVLPEIRQQLGNRLTILCDSGFRRGTDIIKARALGADAVLMGRNTLYGAGAAGAAGIAHVIRILKTELERAMTLLGAASLSEITPEHVRYLGAAHLAEVSAPANYAVLQRRMEAAM
ncbi:alpha-hydroxy acid oxidase [Rhodoligotrophos defluvii]|uniref:alpha-hydroxy acid oxidase n=1 Tax=Rhodoligotrophos defluvii TaxID=2561934 RepID=UPI00148570B4|nr:alpha-hydroxy acid oxidase [Rhodoligotrophos defluvii]